MRLVQLAPRDRNLEQRKMSAVPKLLTVPEVAHQLRVNPQTAYRWAREGTCSWRWPRRRTCRG